VTFVRTKEVLRMLGVSRTTLWRMVQAGVFPPPVVISRRATGHVLEQVEAWMKARIDRSSGVVALSSSQPDDARMPASTVHLPSPNEPAPIPKLLSAHRSPRRRRGRG